jgi:hypothetical protein
VVTELTCPRTIGNHSANFVPTGRAARLPGAVVNLLFTLMLHNIHVYNSVAWLRRPGINH